MQHTVGRNISDKLQQGQKPLKYSYYCHQNKCLLKYSLIFKEQNLFYYFLQIGHIYRVPCTTLGPCSYFEVTHHWSCICNSLCPTSSKTQTLSPYWLPRSPVQRASSSTRQVLRYLRDDMQAKTSRTANKLYHLLELPTVFY